MKNHLHLASRLTGCAQLVKEGDNNLNRILDLAITSPSFFDMHFSPAMQHCTTKIGYYINHLRLAELWIKAYRKRANSD